MALKIYSPDDLKLLKVPLFRKTFGAVRVPGVFKFTPHLLLEAGVSFDFVGDMDISYGFDYKFPFKTQVYSDKGLFAKPDFKHEGKPTLTEHQYKSTKDIEVKISGHLIPSVNIDLEVFQQGYGLKLELDSSSNLTSRMVDFRRSECPEKTLELELFHRHDVNFVISGKQSFHLDIFDTGDLTIACRFCGKCIAPVVPTLPLKKIRITSSANPTTTTNPTSTVIPTITTALTTTIKPTTTVESIVSRLS